MQFKEIPYLWGKDKTECVGVKMSYSFSFLCMYFIYLVIYLAQLILFQCLTSGVCLQVVWVGTCLGAILLGLDLGLVMGLGVELLTVVFRTQL